MFSFFQKFWNCSVLTFCSQISIKNWAVQKCSRFQKLFAILKNVHVFFFSGFLKIVQFQIFRKCSCFHIFQNMFAFSSVLEFKKCSWFLQIFQFLFFCKSAICLCVTDPFVFLNKNAFEIQDIYFGLRCVFGSLSLALLKNH